MKIFLLVPVIYSIIFSFLKKILFYHITIKTKYMKVGAQCFRPLLSTILCAHELFLEEERGLLRKIDIIQECQSHLIGSGGR